MAKDSAADRDRPVFVTIPAFPSDHEDQSRAFGMGTHHEIDEFGMGTGEGHAVQIDLRLWLELAALHLLIGSAVHTHRSLVDPLGDRRRKMVSGSMWGGILANLKR